MDTSASGSQCSNITANATAWHGNLARDDEDKQSVFRRRVLNSSFFSIQLVQSVCLTDLSVVQVCHKEVKQMTTAAD